METIEKSKYILLETYKKDNTPVKTTVWFIHYDNQIYVVTRDKTGKIKRLRNNPKLRYSSCTFNGRTSEKGESGYAKFVDTETTNEILKIRKKKYGFMDSIARFMSKNKGNLIVFAISEKA
jgi:uncharacterized protein